MSSEFVVIGLVDLQYNISIALLHGRLKPYASTLKAIHEKN